MKTDGFKRAFTMMEVLISLVVISIVAAAAIISYQGYRERVDEMTDETNQLILQTAIKVFATDTGNVAGELGQLRPSDLERAYAMVGQGKKPYTMVAHLLEGLWHQLIGTSIAEAYIPPKYFNNDLRVITCPRDLSKPTGFDPTGKPLGGISYEITGPFRDKPLSFLLDPQNAEIPLIYEADSSNGGEVFRHRGGHVAVRTNAAGRAGTVNNREGLLPCSSDPISGGGTGGIGDRTPPRTPSSGYGNSIP